MYTSSYCFTTGTQWREPTLHTAGLVAVVHAVGDAVAAPAGGDTVGSVLAQELLLRALSHTVHLSAQRRQLLNAHTCIVQYCFATARAVSIHHVEDPVTLPMSVIPQES